MRTQIGHFDLLSYRLKIDLLTLIEYERDQIHRVLIPADRNELEHEQGFYVDDGSLQTRALGVESFHLQALRVFEQGRFDRKAVACRYIVDLAHAYVQVYETMVVALGPCDAELRISNRVSEPFQEPSEPAKGCLVSDQVYVDRKSTRLNSSHSQISYAVFCLKKKKKNITEIKQS